MLRRILPLAAMLAVSLAAATVAQAAEIAVTTSADGPIDGVTNDGLCSLREAVLAARNDLALQGCTAGSGADVVVLGAGTLTISQPGDDIDGFTGDLDTSGAVRIVGRGAGATVIQVTTSDRAFDVLPIPGASLTLEDLTIRGGNVPQSLSGPGGQGGAIRNQGALTLVRVTLDQNAAGRGASAMGGSAGGDGGAVWSGFQQAARVTVIDSTFTGNRAGSAGSGGNAQPGGDGGAIRIAAGSLAVSGSTFIDNVAGDADGSGGDTGGPGGDGGAIAVGPGSVTVANSTFLSNRGGQGGSGATGVRNSTGGTGAVWVSGGSGLVEYSTFLGNQRGLGSAGGNTAAGAFVGGSILADPEPRCGGITAHLRNVLSTPDASCPAPNLVGPVNLGLLAANGGPTQTLVPGAGSAAIDALAGAACPATDQRGLPRPGLGGCDAGAVEVQTGAAAPAPRRGVTGLAARRVSSLTLSPAVFRAARSGASVGVATKSLQAKAPIGTTVRYRLDGAARVTFTITKPVAGRRKGRRCVRPAAAKPGAKRCIRTQKLKGSFAHQGVAGQNAFRFTGRLRGKALPPGRYTLVAKLPRPATGASALTRKAFRIVR